MLLWQICWKYLKAVLKLRSVHPWVSIEIWTKLAHKSPHIISETVNWLERDRREAAAMLTFYIRKSVSFLRSFVTRYPRPPAWLLPHAHRSPHKRHRLLAISFKTVLIHLFWAFEQHQACYGICPLACCLQKSKSQKVSFLKIFISVCSRDCRVMFVCTVEQKLELQNRHVSRQINVQK